MMKQTNGQKILSFLLSNPNTPRAEIIAKSGVKHNSVSVTLIELKKAGFISQPEYARYSLTDIGIEKAKGLKSQSTEFVNKRPELKVKGIRLDDPDTIIALKNSYGGREELLKALDKLRRILE